MLCHIILKLVNLPSCQANDLQYVLNILPIGNLKPYHPATRLITRTKKPDYITPRLTALAAESTAYHVQTNPINTSHLTRHLTLRPSRSTDAHLLATSRFKLYTQSEMNFLCPVPHL